MRKNHSAKPFQKMLAAVLCLAMVASATVSATGSSAGSSSDSFAQKMEERFADPEMNHKLYARWWLAEGSHTDETLIESVHELYDAGFGGIEFLTLDESRYLDDQRYAWGSEEWIHDSHLVAKTCAELGMGFSVTSGTHWATANLVNITPDEDTAAQELGYRTVELNQGESVTGALPQCALPGQSTKQTLVKVIAAQKTGTVERQVGNCSDEAITLDQDSLTDLTNQVYQDENGSYCINYTAKSQNMILFVFWKYGTSESFKPAVTGQSYTINYLDTKGTDVLIQYWEEHVLDEEMRGYIQQVDEADLYMDSLELLPKGRNTTGQLWSADYLEQFSSRRGYDLSLYLPFMILRQGSKAGNDQGNLRYQYELAGDKDFNFADNLRNDSYQTNTELYQENCLQPLAEWLHSFGMKLRAENSYGTMFEISQPIKDLDYVETESFEFGTEPELFRNMSGAAHLYNTRYSSETGAMYYQNYYNNNNYYRQIFYTQYASGIQKVVTHGYASAYGPEQKVSWPGYEGMMSVFSERYDRRQPWSVDYPELHQHLNRVQQVLEQGVPQMDLAILRNDYFMNCGLLRNEGSKDYYNNDFHQNNGIYWQDMSLQNAGYTYDHFSPYLLQDEDISCEDGLIQSDGVGYQAILVYQEEMPYESAKILLEWAKNGLPVILVDGPSTEFVRYSDPTGKVYKYNRSAAIKTGSNDGLDDEMIAIMNQIRQLDNVRSVESQEQAYDALAELGVRPRAEYLESNQKIVPVMRKSEDATYLFLYHYMYQDKENYVGQISVDGLYEPYVLNTWSGDTNKVIDYAHQDGRTILNVDIAPGEIMIFALDPDAQNETTVIDKHNVHKLTVEDGTTQMIVNQNGPASVTYSDGSTFSTNVSVLDDILLNRWDLTVESFEPGEKVYRTEDRGLGYTTTEVAYTTNKVPKQAGELEELKPWKDIEAVGEKVSGVGHYTTTFTLPENWSAENQVIEFQAESFQDGTAALFVNGQQVNLDMDSRDADISAYCVPGNNSIEVRVTSSLRNVMRSLGYSAWNFPGSWTSGTGPADYGMTGEVRLITSTKVPVVASEANKTILSAVLAYAEMQYESDEFGNVIADVQSTFTTALENARAINTNIAATQQEVDSAWKILMTEIHKLGFIRGDKTALKELIQLADTFNAQIEKYTPATAEPFASVLVSAKAVLDDENAMQDDVSKVESTLLDAMMNLRFKADKSILESVLAKASEVDITAYTAESVAAFNEANAKAKAINEDENVTQEEVDGAVNKLNKAIENLVIAENTPIVVGKEGDTNLSAGKGNAKTGDTSPITAVLSLFTLMSAGFILSKKKK